VRSRVRLEILQARSPQRTLPRGGGRWLPRRLLCARGARRGRRGFDHRSGLTFGPGRGLSARDDVHAREQE
jgi:hypothetical protein